MSQRVDKPLRRIHAHVGVNGTQLLGQLLTFRTGFRGEEQSKRLFLRHKIRHVVRSKELDESLPIDAAVPAWCTVCWQPPAIDPRQHRRGTCANHADNLMSGEVRAAQNKILIRQTQRGALAVSSKSIDIRRISLASHAHPR